MSTIKYTVTEGKPEDLVSYESFNEQDVALVDVFDLDTTIDPQRDNVELHIYTLDQRLVFSKENFKEYTVLKGGSRKDTVINDITLNPEIDARNAGFTKGDVNLLYNFTSNLFSLDNSKPGFYIDSISSDRTEIRALSKEVSSTSIVTFVNEIKSKLQNLNYFNDFRLNFGKNNLVIGVNIDFEEYKNSIAVLLKLYEPLPTSISTKTKFTIEELKADSILFKVLSSQVEPIQVFPKLRGPNFNLEDLEDSSSPSQFLSFTDLLGYPVSSSYYEIYSLADKKSIPISADYTDFNSFIHFSSAEERLKNFKYKVQLIESYESSINTFKSEGNSNTGSYETQIKNIVSNFDHYDNYLYFNTGSWSWPKTTTERPYKLAHSTSSLATNWYSSILTSGSNYDSTNIDRLINTIPSFLKDDPNNQAYLLFVDMIGNHFDNIWIYTKNITSKYDADNRLDFGVQKDLVRDALKSFGIKLYENNESLENLFNYFVGEKFTTDIYPNTYSYKIVSKDTYLKEIYKRIYHNLPFLLKTKGTERGLRALINCFGIPSDILSLKIFGGQRKNQSPQYSIDNFFTSSLDKIRTDETGSLLEGSTLSFYTKTELDQRNYNTDLQLLEVGFGINDSIDTYFKNTITGSFNLDNYIGDPRYTFTSSYNSLNKFLDSSLISGSFYLNSFNSRDFINLIGVYNNTLFRMIKDFTPSRVNLSTGIVIKPSFLNRNRVKHTLVSSSIYYYTGSLSTAFITGSGGGSFGSIYSGSKIEERYNTSYSDRILFPSGGFTYITTLHGNDQGKINGEFSGSILLVTRQDISRLNKFKKI